LFVEKRAGYAETEIEKRIRFAYLARLWNCNRLAEICSVTQPDDLLHISRRRSLLQHKSGDICS
jgi:hypothetical protein